jgi:uncharacterized protein
MHFFLKLIPPRATFPGDITDAERALMLQHRDYMQTCFDGGIVLSYGPVMAPEGSFGFAIFEVPESSIAESIMQKDPTIIAGLNRYELYPMRLGAAQGSRNTQ